jgi:hypothetical protein
MSRPSLQRGAARVLVVVAALSSAQVARAQESGQTKRFAAAQTLYDEGQFAAAYEAFRTLATETGSPNADLYAARCLRDLGKLPEAYEAMRAALRNATAKADKDPKYLKTRNTAAADLALLELKVAKVVIAIASPPAGLTVTLDGAAFPADHLGVPLAHAPGEAVVRTSAPGKQDTERRVQLKAGETTTVTLALDAATGPAAPPGAEPAPEPATTGGGVRIGGFVVLGLGAAGMATFAAAGVLANKRYDSVSNACGGTHCPASYASQIQGGRQLDIVADVGLGVGIAGLAAGALMVALGGPKAAPPVTGWATSSAGGVAVRLGFQ